MTDLYGNLRHLRPAAPPDGEDDPEDEPGRDLAVPPPDEMAVRADDAVVAWEEPLPPPAIPRIVTVIVVRTREVATNEVTKTVARHAAYIPIGAGIVFKRIWNAKTNAPFDQAIRTIQGTGNLEALGEWMDRAEKARDNRHRRRMDWLAAPFALAKTIAGALLTLTGVLILLGIAIAIADHKARQIGAPLMGVVHLVRNVAWVISITWRPALLLALAVGVYHVWNLGRMSGAGPKWLVGGDGQGVGAVVTADGIVIALRHLQIAQLTKAFDKDAFRAPFHQPPRRDGRGYWAVVGLPLGVTPQMVADKRPLLARNLHRAEIETWPSDAEKVGTGPAGFLDLWIADPGAIAKAAPEYPLLHEGTADVFEGVPGGVSPRGDALKIPIVSNNFVTGGMMGQGKSNACRVIMLGCALDPLVELCVFVFAGNGDFDAYRDRLSKYERGADDSVAADALAHLQHLLVEVGRRETRLAQLGAKKVTRALAEKHRDLRPIVSLFSECHELFGHKEYGEQAADVAVQVLRRARKTAIVLGFDTQSSRKDAIPPKIVELVSVNACFAVKSWRSNDGFLGDGSFAAGIRATELRPTTDRGTSLITGISDASFELLKWYFVAVDDDTGFDAAADVIARAMEDLAPGTRTAGGTAGEIERPVERDLLEDLEVVLGEQTVPAADLPALLARHAPDWVPYRRMTGKALRELLAREHGVKVPSTGNRWPVHPKLIADALTRRKVK